MKKCLMLLSLVMLFCGCNQVESPRIYTKADSGQSIELKIGQTAAIQLEENPTTGYGWEFFSEPEKQQIIGDFKAEYRQDRAEKDFVGVGGTKTYSFKALSKGTVTLLGYYYRSWENKDADSVDKVKYEITVK